MRVVDNYRAYSVNRLYSEATQVDDQSKLTLPVTEDGFNSLIVPAKLGCTNPHDICHLLIKKDIINAERNKSLTNIKPKQDLVDIYRSHLRMENEKNEVKRPPVV